MSAQRPKHKRQVAVIWPDGCMDVAANWLALFDRIRRDQWHDFTRKQFRSEMSRRSEVLLGTPIDLADCDYRTFFERLEAADMCRIVEEMDLVA